MEILVGSLLIEPFSVEAVGWLYHVVLGQTPCALVEDPKSQMAAFARRL